MLTFLSHRNRTLSLFLQLTRLQKNIEQIKLHLSSRFLLIQQPTEDLQPVNISSSIVWKLYR